MYILQGKNKKNYDFPCTKGVVIYAGNPISTSIFREVSVKEQQVIG